MAARISPSLLNNRTCSKDAACPIQSELDVKCVSIAVNQTLGLRQSVLWPNKPLSHVQLPEDSDGWHFGAFIASETGEDPVAVISLFLEQYPIDNHSTTYSATTKDRDGPDIAVSATRLPTVGVLDGPSMVHIRARFRKFACHPDFQGRGIGTHLLRHTLDFARSSLGASVVWCDARTSTAEWYEKRGLSRFGQVFFKGDVEYVRMRTKEHLAVV